MVEYTLRFRLGITRWRGFQKSRLRQWRASACLLRFLGLNHSAQGLLAAGVTTLATATHLADSREEGWCPKPPGAHG